MRAKKEYSLVALGHLISRVESFVNGEESPANRFILLNKSVRYLNLRSLKKAIVDKWDPGFKNAYMKLYPDSPKAALRMLYGSVFKRVEFFSSADVIVIRANISLFYLAKGIRIKLFMPGGVRSLVEFKNEIDIPAKIAIPPKVGTLVLCDVRPFGLSTKFLAFATATMVGIEI